MRKDPETNIPETSDDGHVEYAMVSSDLSSLAEDEEMYTIRYDGNWDIIAKAGGSVCWQLEGESSFHVERILLDSQAESLSIRFTCKRTNHTESN